MNMGGVDGVDMMLYFYNDNWKFIKVWKKNLLLILFIECVVMFIFCIEVLVKFCLRFI